MANYSYDQIADYLTDGYWDDNASQQHHYNVTAGDTLTFNVSGISAAGQNLAREAFKVWSDATGINFVEVNTGGTITFSDHNGDPNGDAWGGSSYYPSTGFSASGVVHISQSWLGSYGTTIDSYSFQTYVHEIGHVLGLGHAGNYNGGGTYGVDNHYDNDSWQATVMSYFNQDWENTSVTASYAYVITPQIADLIAIQNLYGVPTNTNLGDTIYGYNNTVTGSSLDGITGYSNNVTFTLFDSGGTDTIDTSLETAAQNIDMRAESISDAFGLTGNMMIARGTVIENFIGGSGVDNVRGNSAANNIQGGNGGDILLGKQGNDTLSGGPGNDILKGQSGNDTIYGGDNNDIISGGTGNDFLYGDGGNDKLRGRAGTDTLDGGAGNDMLWGGSGADSLTGGTGADQFIFRFASDANGDTIVDFNDGEGDIIKIRGFNQAQTTITDLGSGNYTVEFGGNTVNVTVADFGTGGTLDFADDFVFV